MKKVLVLLLMFLPFLVLGESITDVYISEETLNSLAFNWTTDYECIGKILISEKESGIAQEFIEVEASKSHKLKCDGLTDNTAYVVLITDTEDLVSVTHYTSTPDFFKIPLTKEQKILKECIEYSPKKFYKNIETTIEISSLNSEDKHNLKYTIKTIYIDCERNPELFTRTLTYTIYKGLFSDYIEGFSLSHLHRVSVFNHIMWTARDILIEKLNNEIAEKQGYIDILNQDIDVPNIQ